MEGPAQVNGYYSPQQNRIGERNNDQMCPSFFIYQLVPVIYRVIYSWDSYTASILSSSISRWYYSVSILHTGSPSVSTELTDSNPNPSDSLIRH